MTSAPIAPVAEDSDLRAVIAFKVTEKSVSPKSAFPYNSSSIENSSDMPFFTAAVDPLPIGAVLAKIDRPHSVLLL